MFILWLLEISFVFSESPFEAAKGLSPVKTLFTSFLVGFFVFYSPAFSRIKSISLSIAIGSSKANSTGVSVVPKTT